VHIKPITILSPEKDHFNTEHFWTGCTGHKKEAYRTFWIKQNKNNKTVKNIEQAHRNIDKNFKTSD